MKPSVLHPTAEALRWGLWLVILGLSCLGMVMVASATAGMGANGPDAAAGHNSSYIVKQGIAFILGLFVACGVSWFGVERLRKTSVVAVVGGSTLVALLLVHVIGREGGGATRWIPIGGGFNVQPSELAKLCLVICGAWYLSRCAEKVRMHWQGAIVPLAGFGMLAGLVYLTKDLGSVLVLAAIYLGLLVFAGAPWRYTGTLFLAITPLGFFVAVLSESYRRERVLGFIEDPMSIYQIKQSLICFGSGGLLGTGLGEGQAKLFLPERHTDFIFAVIGEETGLVGSMGVVLGYLLLIAIGSGIAAATRDRHHRLLAIGVTILLGVQAMWNMAVATAAAPTKGLTLPFISYGGSSLLVCIILVGVLDAVARAIPSTVALKTKVSRVGAQFIPEPTVRTSRPRLASMRASLQGFWSGFTKQKTVMAGSGKSRNGMSAANSADYAVSSVWGDVTKIPTEANPDPAMPSLTPAPDKQP